MSWIIQSLLNRKNYIREVNDIDSDEYNDLLLVEKAMNDLKDRGLLSQEDLEIVDEMSGDLGRFEERNKTQKETMAKKYSVICERLAFYMGDYFTDEGYINYMTKKYRLDTQQVEILQSYIKSRFKHKIARKVHSNPNIKKEITDDEQT